MNDSPMKAVSAALGGGLTPERSPFLTVAAFGIGLLLSALLVFQHFGALTLPSCGDHSACAVFLVSHWNNVLGWPICFLSLAYFAACGATWAATASSGPPPALRLLVRLGVLASLGCLLAMCLAGAVCWYCVGLHAANMVLAVAIERSRQLRPDLPDRPITKPLAVFGASFALVSALLGVAASEQARLAQEQMARARFSASTSPVSQSDAGTANTSGADHGAASRSAKLDAQSVDERAHAQHVHALQIRAPQVPAQTVDQAASPRQTHRLGPAEAPLRLIVFYDYQSHRCQQVEREIQELLAAHGDRLSVTARHYPSCAQCNLWHTGSEHANACRAARAAEAAGLLKGEAGFWQMHHWLLEHAGQFTDEQLSQSLLAQGYSNPQQFLEAMEQPQTLAGILADIVEARTRQISNAPTVLLNGKRLALAQNANSIAKAVVAMVEQADAANAAQPVATSLSPIDPSIADKFGNELQLRAIASTVRIVNAAGRSMGSGAIIALRDPFVYVLTARHIVAGTTSVEVHTFSEPAYPEPAGKHSRASVIATSARSDLALIRFTSREPTLQELALAPAEHEPQPLDSHVLTVGCGGDSAPPTCLATRALKIRSLRREAGTPATSVWEVADPSAEGRSGGALLDQRGQLLGIASGNSDGYGYFSDASEIHHFLEEHGLEGLCSPELSQQSTTH